MKDRKTGHYPFSKKYKGFDSYSVLISFSFLLIRCLELRKKVYIAFDTNFADRQRNALIELIKTFLPN